MNFLGSKKLFISEKHLLKPNTGSQLFKVTCKVLSILLSDGMVFSLQFNFHLFP